LRSSSVKFVRICATVTAGVFPPEPPALQDEEPQRQKRERDVVMPARALKVTACEGYEPCFPWGPDFPTTGGTSLQRPDRPLNDDSCLTADVALTPGILGNAPSSKGLRRVGADV